MAEKDSFRAPTYVTLRRIQDLLIDRATGRISIEDEEAKKWEYANLRENLLRQISNPKHIPDIVKESTNLDLFWHRIKKSFSNYEERRTYLYGIFTPILLDLESNITSPADDVFSLTLNSFDLHDISPVWQKALERRNDDPEGAITIARSLLELTCKKILTEMNEPCTGNDLPTLYKSVASKLNLSPGSHSEQLFKQILGSCQNIVESLGAIRNRHSDSHGQTKTYTPAVRHAELAVNLSGTMSTFLVATWNSQRTNVA